MSASGSVGAATSASSTATGTSPHPCWASSSAAYRAERPDFAIGSKRHPDSVVVYPWLRRFYSWGYQVLTRLLLGLDVTDTQSGIKLARREIVTELLPILEEDGFTFDLELLAVARRLGYTSVVELPVEIRERFSSTVSPRAAVGMLVHAVRLTWRLRVAHHYERALRARRLTSLKRRPVMGVADMPARSSVLGDRPEPFHDPVDTGGQGLDVVGLDGREQGDPQLVPSQLAVGLGVDDAVGPQAPRPPRAASTASSKSMVAVTWLRSAGSGHEGLWRSSDRSAQL